MTTLENFYFGNINPSEYKQSKDTRKKLPFSDYYSIDISPDIHIRRVMSRMGLVPKGAPIEMIIYKAREIYPSFPGIIDFSMWEIGRNWCFANKKPNCENCVVRDSCEKHI